MKDLRKALEITGPVEWLSESKDAIWRLERDLPDSWFLMLRNTGCSWPCEEDEITPYEAYALIEQYFHKWLVKLGVQINQNSTRTWISLADGREIVSPNYLQALIAAVLAAGKVKS